MSGPDPLRPLLDAAREGDDVALARLVRETQPLVWRCCRALGGAGEEEDLVQEVYLRALRSLDGYRGEAPVRAWILSIARHVCADHVRRRERQRRLLHRLRATAVDGYEPPVGPIDDLLARLDPDRREAFVLTQVLGLAYAEAAEVLGCPIGTVRSRVARARAQLHGALRAADVR
jgi:RNA polymerase sigma-70 factor (ECF subfamily)